MCNLNQLMNGISKYLDNEILVKINGWQKWIVGAGTSMYLANGTNIFNNLKANNLVKQMNLINENDEINIDEMYKYLLKEAQKGAVTFNVPIVGALTLNENDVSKLYNYIIGG